MKPKFIVILCASITLTIAGFSQSGKSVVIGTMTNKPNAVLVLNPPDGNQGFLLPQVTTTARLSIRPASPSEDGLVVYDITDKAFYFWKDSQWNKGLGGGQTITFDQLTQKLSISNGNVVDLSTLKEIPSISGQAGKYITTDGTTLSWATLTNVTKLQGNPVNSAVLTPADNGKALIWNGTEWVATSTSTIVPATAYYAIDPADFRIIKDDDREENATIFESNTEFITVLKRDKGNKLISAIHLPNGALMTQVTVFYMDNIPNNIRTKVWKKPYASSKVQIGSDLVTSGSSPLILSQNLNTSEIIDNNLNTYRIEIELDPIADSDDASEAMHRIYGVRITYNQ